MQALFENQKTSVAFFRGKPCTFDASDPGTGKTRVAIEMIRTRRVPTLILCPKSLVRNAWAVDFRKFAPELTISLAFATNRAKAFEKEANVYITNLDAAAWLAKQPLPFWRKFANGFLIIDEIGGYKHHTAIRSKSAVKIRKHFAMCHGMNGSVNTNGIQDVYHQYFLVDKGERLGKSFYAFRSATCVAEPVPNRPQYVKWSDRDGAEAAVADLVRDITVRHKFEDCIDIPANHQYPAIYCLNEPHRVKYETMQRAHLLALPDGLIDAVHAAALSTKLLQIASGAVYETEGIYHVIDRERYEMVMDMVEARKHCLVFFLWKHQKEELIAEAEARGMSYAVLDGESTDKEKEITIQGFQAGYYKVLLAHPKSAAHGLTLVKGTSTIWASPTYNLEWFVQGNKRIYRAGQTEKTETVVVIAEGTIDEKVYDALSHKKVRMDALLAELKHGL
jgi:hypothetical protein